jgi:pilus assembly protein Flp/PilA
LAALDELSGLLTSERAKEGGAAMLFLPREEGQGLVEYALIILFIAIVVIAVLLIFGPTVGNMYSSIREGVTW